MADLGDPHDPSVTVVIPARDAAELLPGALDAVGAQELEGSFEVVVVDNGSCDGTAEVAAAHACRPRVLRLARGGGPGVARNAGAAAARAPVLAFTDADCRPGRRWLAAALDALAAVDLVQGAVVPPPGTVIGPFDHSVQVQWEYGLYETANLVVRRAWFERVGGFEDWVATGDGRPFGEDALFAWRLRRAGGRTTFSRSAIVHHEVFPGTPGSYLAERLRVRFFPELVRLVPELRDAFLHRRVFLSPRSARFDAALVGLALAVATRRPLPLALAAPYARAVRRNAVRWGRHPAAAIAAVQVAGDFTAFAVLLNGSLRSRSLVL